MEKRDIHTSPDEVGDVLITITYPQGGGEARATLRVEDQMSSEVLVQVDLDPAQFMRAIGSGAVPVKGARLPAHPERIGRRMQNTSTNVSLSGAAGQDLDAEAEKIRQEYLADGWEKVTVDRTNYGRRVRAYRWVADESGGNNA